MLFNQCLKSMKIRKVKWANHPILGNLELDFVNPVTNKPYSTIVLAGENGTGKTTILETLNTFLSIGSFEPFDGIEYEVEDKRYILIPSNIPGSLKTFFTRYDVENNTSENIHSDKNNSPDSIHSDNKDPRSYGSVFSRPRADYKTSKIESVKTNELDKNKYDSDKDDNFTSLKQLIVDVQNQDNERYSDINDERQAQNLPAMTKGEFEQISKIYRFKKAFNDFFDKIKYKKVANKANEKVVLFEKNGFEISLDYLSTGEKQIVFRGAYLLKNLSLLNNSTIMIDEPELSMHPKWQEKILQYYKALFTDDAGNQIVQLFIATHSDHVLKEAFKDQSNTLVVVLHENNGIIQSSHIIAPNILPSITIAETNFLAFDIVSNDFHIELYGWLQQKEGLTSIVDTDNFIVSHPLYNPLIHEKTYAHPNGRTTYRSLSTYIRNAIDHPNITTVFSDNELRTSIELLIDILR